MGIIIGVSSFFLWSNVSEMRKEFADSVDKIKSNAKESIELTQKQSEQQISGIKEAAKRLAEDEAMKRVNEVFQRTNISSLVEATAKQQVGASVQRLVASEMDIAASKFQEQIYQLGLVSDLASKMRLGFRGGLVGLDKLRRDNSASETVRSSASKLFQQIAEDYDTVAFSHYGADTGVDPKKRRQFWHLPDSTSDSALAAHLVHVILNDSDLNAAAMATLMLRVHTGIKFKMFDLDPIRAYCKEKHFGC